MTSDERIAKTEKWLKELYAEAERDMRGKWDAYMKRQEKRVAKLQEAIDKAKTPADKKEAVKKYRKVLVANMYGNKNYKDMVETLAQEYAEAGIRAAEIINMERYGAFADGYNLSAKAINRVAIEKNIGIRFDLCDAGTISELAEHAEDLLLPPRAHPELLDMTVWNVHNINAQVSQGIVQGESIPHIAERLERVTHMNEVASVRTARTMTTACENAGRVQSMQTAEKWGVKTRKQWLCTHDSRTRHSHLEIDGETVDQEAEFSNKCKYPGDPNGPPEEVYNCRCTLITVVDGFSSNLPRGKESTVGIEIDGEVLKYWRDAVGVDVSEEYRQKAKPGYGKVILEEGIKPGKHKAEIRAAEYIHDQYGGDVVVKNETTDQGQKNPDLLWDGVLWDVKNPSTEKSAENSIRGGVEQIEENPGGIILDYRGHKIDLDTAFKIISDSVGRHYRTPVDILVVFDDEDDIVVRYRRTKK